MVRPARPASDDPTVPPSPEQLVLEHAWRLYDLALKMLGDEADAEDLTHEVLLRAARKLEQFPDGTTLHEWLSCVTAAEALARRLQRLFPPPGHTSQPPAAGEGLEGRIEAAIASVLHRRPFPGRPEV
jgi:DNA-directed RNA polymerase specialized sigma24 family protein